MNLLARANAWLGRTMATHAGVDFLLVRGDHRTPIRCVIGHTDAERTVDESMVMQTRLRNYLVDVVAYQINGRTAEPQRGDRIIEPGGAVYEILPPAGEPAWRYSDPQRTRYRLHARRVAAP